MSLIDIEQLGNHLDDIIKEDVLIDIETAGTYKSSICPDKGTEDFYVYQKTFYKIMTDRGCHSILSLFDTTREKIGIIKYESGSIGDSVYEAVLIKFIDDVDMKSGEIPVGGCIFLYVSGNCSAGFSVQRQDYISGLFQKKKADLKKVLPTSYFFQDPISNISSSNSG